MWFFNSEQTKQKRIYGKYGIAYKTGLQHLENLHSHEPLLCVAFYSREVQSQRKLCFNQELGQVLLSCKKCCYIDLPFNVKISSNPTHSRLVDLMLDLRSHPPTKLESTENYGKQTFSNHVFF